MASSTCSHRTTSGFPIIIITGSWTAKKTEIRIDAIVPIHAAERAFAAIACTITEAWAKSLPVIFQMTLKKPMTAASKILLLYFRNGAHGYRE
jgi:hypothetical protein